MREEKMIKRLWLAGLIISLFFTINQSAGQVAVITEFSPEFSYFTELIIKELRNDGFKFVYFKKPSQKKVTIIINDVPKKYWKKHYDPETSQYKKGRGEMPHTLLISENNGQDRNFSVSVQNSYSSYLYLIFSTSEPEEFYKEKPNCDMSFEMFEQLKKSRAEYRLKLKNQNWFDTQFLENKAKIAIKTIIWSFNSMACYRG